MEHEPQDCLEPSHAAVAGQLAEQSPQRVQPVQLVAAEGEQHQHRAVAEAGGQEGDQVAGGAVGPAQALHDQQRPSRGQPLDHAQQELEEPPLTGAPNRGAHGLPVAPGKVGNQAGQLGTGGTGNRFQLVRVEGAGQPTQRLGDRRERHALLTERHAAAAQHQHALLGGGDGHLVGQPGLADLRLPLTSATSGSPPAVCVRRPRSRASSSVRPTKRPVMTWYAMTPSMLVDAYSPMRRRS